MLIKVDVINTLVNPQKKDILLTAGFLMVVCLRIAMGDGLFWGLSSGFLSFCVVHL